MSVLPEHQTVSPTATSNPSSRMDQQLYNAAQSGDVALLCELVARDPSMLRGTTPSGNTCLHIAAMFGREDFAHKVSIHTPALLAAANSNGETPLIVAIAFGHSSLASSYLKVASERLTPTAAADVEVGGMGQFKEMVLKADRWKDTALHHAIRNYQGDLALALLRAELGLSVMVNDNDESPLFMAASRGLAAVVDELLQHPSAALGGPGGETALHRAVLLKDVDLVRNMVKKRPAVAGTPNASGNTPLHYATNRNKAEMVRLLLEHDPSLAYILNKNGASPFTWAAYRGHVPAAQEIVRRCPDAAYVVGKNGMNAFHVAIQEGKAEFVKFVLRTPALHGLLSKRDAEGWSPLHFATARCDPEAVRSLLAYKVADPVAVEHKSLTAMDFLYNLTESINTLKWNEVFTLLSATDAITTANLVWRKAERSLAEKAEKKKEKLLKSYTNNTTIVAILITAVTFAAAFTVPGGYNNDQGPGEGLPILAWRFAFKAFMISDTLAMCSSLAVAFFCILAGLEDLSFLLYYKRSTRTLMWFAYCTTVVAFATGMYTVLAPNSLWLAVLLCVLCCALPLLTYLLGVGPICYLRLRLGRSFRSDLIERF